MFSFAPVLLSSFTVLLGLYGNGQAQAQTSLYIPGNLPLAISVSNLGAGSDGLTTWELQGLPTDGGAALLGTATLAEGPDRAVLVYSTAGLVEIDDCALSDGLALCTDVISTLTVLTTETPVFRTLLDDPGTTTESASSTPATSTPVPKSAPSSGFSTASQTGTPASASASASSTAKAGSGAERMLVGSLVPYALGASIACVLLSL